MIDLYAFMSSIRLQKRLTNPEMFIKVKIYLFKYIIGM